VNFLMRMDFSNLLALGIFSSYFVLIIGLFSTILKSLPHRDLSAFGTKRHVYAFRALAVFSFIHTWFYMFKFMAWSLLEYEKTTSGSQMPIIDRVASWLSNTELFEQAWVAVCFGHMNWWWSEQLCLFTAGAWTIFLAVEGRRHRIKHLWAYMLLGQVVAISVASNLFYLAIILSRTPSQPRGRPSPSMASPTLWISVLFSLITVGLTPFTSQHTFLPNLLVMHTLLLVPLLPFPNQKADGHPGLSIRTSTLYALVTVLAIASRTRTTAVALLSLPTQSQSLRGLASSAWDVLHSHPAQSSIGWDVIWTTISFTFWILARKAYVPSFSSAPIYLASFLASVGITAPYLLRQETKSN